MCIRDRISSLRSSREELQDSLPGKMTDAGQIEKRIAEIQNRILAIEEKTDSLRKRREEVLQECGSISETVRQLDRRVCAAQKELEENRGKLKALLEGSRLSEEEVWKQREFLSEQDKLRPVSYTHLYKSGKKAFRLNDVLYGLNLQMLLYLHCIIQNGKGKYQDCLPAGILYMPAGEQPPVLDRAADEETIVLAKRKCYQMNGLLLEDRELLAAMDSSMSGIYIPVSLKKDGEFTEASKNSLATLAELGKINAYIDRLVVNMASELHRGKIEACLLYTSCAESCPSKTIWIKNRKAMIGYEKCIRCFCCHEMCPEKAIDIRQFRLFRL